MPLSQENFSANALSRLMSYNLDKRLEEEIISVAKKNNVEKLFLFGSRARGDNHKRSDIDLAVKGGNITNFYFDIEEEVSTLLSFDIVDIDDTISKTLQAEIKRDGVLIYEKI